MNPLLGLMRAVVDPDLVDAPRGVNVHVYISPRACLEAVCGGELPGTGGSGMEMLVWAGLALTMLGIGLVIARGARRRVLGATSDA